MNQDSDWIFFYLSLFHIILSLYGYPIMSDTSLYRRREAKEAGWRDGRREGEIGKEGEGKAEAKEAQHAVKGRMCSRNPLPS